MRIPAAEGARGRPPPVMLSPPLRPRLSGLVVALALLARVASAQVAPPSQRGDSARRRDTTTALPPVNVRASILPAAGATVGSGVPARITIIGQRALEAWAPRRAPEALASQAGISLHDDLGSPSKVNVTSRGFVVGPTVGQPAGLSVFLDGVRQNEADAQQVDFDLLPMQHVESVELLSGAASLLGPNSLGGALNLVSRRGSGPARGEIELAGGSFGARSEEGSVSGSTSGGWDYYAGGGHERERGWRQGTDAEQSNGFLNLGRTGERRGANLQAYLARSQAHTAGSLPESLFVAAPQSNFTEGDFEDLRAAQVALSGYAPVGAGKGTLTAHYRRYDAERFNVNQAPDPNVRGLTSSSTAGATADWRLTRHRGSRTVSVRAGLDGAASWVRARIYAESTATGGSAAGVRHLTTEVRSPSLDLAGYLLADARLGRVSYSVGARYDYVRIPFHDVLDPSANATNTYRSITPRAGASVDLGGGASMYASIGTSFRAPAILELGCADPEATCPLPFALGEDPPLRAMMATTYEVGGQWARWSMLATASVYRTEVRDEIFFVAAKDAPLAGYFTNLPRTRRSGVELSLQGQPFGERLSWYANFALSHATFRTAATLFSVRSESRFASSPFAGANVVRPGDRLPLIPGSLLKGGVTARPIDALELGAEARYVGRQWARGDEANETGPLDAYAVADARLSYTVGAWEISGIVTNVFDSRAATFGTFNENHRTGELERFLTPIGARAFRLGVRRVIGGGDAPASQSRRR